MWLCHDELMIRVQFLHCICTVMVYNTQLKRQVDVDRDNMTCIIMYIIFHVLKHGILDTKDM